MTRTVNKAGVVANGYVRLSDKKKCESNLMQCLTESHFFGFRIDNLIAKEKDLIPGVLRLPLLSLVMIQQELLVFVFECQVKP